MGNCRPAFRTYTASIDGALQHTRWQIACGRHLPHRREGLRLPSDNSACRSLAHWRDGLRFASSHSACRCLAHSGPRLLLPSGRNSGWPGHSDTYRSLSHGRNGLRLPSNSSPGRRQNLRTPGARIKADQSAPTCPAHKGGAGYTCGMFVDSVTNRAITILSLLVEI